MSENNSITLSDGCRWTPLTHPPGFWCGESKYGNTFFMRAPFCALGQFTADDYRKIADALDQIAAETPPAP